MPKSTSIRPLLIFKSEENLNLIYHYIQNLFIYSEDNTITRLLITIISVTGKHKIFHSSLVNFAGHFPDGGN